MKKNLSFLKQSFQNTKTEKIKSIKRKERIMSSIISAPPSSSSLPKKNSVWEKIKSSIFRLIDAIDRHQIFTQSAALAYFTALSLAPFVLILLFFSSLLSDTSQEQVYIQVRDYLSPQLGEAVRMIIENAGKKASFAGASGLFGLFILSLSASTSFSQLRTALDKINETDPSVRNKNRNSILIFLREKLFSIALVFGFNYLAVASLAFTTILGIFFQGREGFFWRIISIATNLGLFLFLFAVIFYFVPTDRKKFRTTILPALIGAATFIFGKELISYYLQTTAVGSSYGAAGALIVFLAWTYYSSLTLLLSFELGHFGLKSVAASSDAKKSKANQTKPS
jgi:membrane protein